MKKESRNKYLFKNTLIFAIGNFGSKMINFFLVPLYTYILSTSEYGTIDLITIITTVIIPIITLNIAESIMRFSIDKEADRNKILNLGLLVIAFLIILGFISYPILKIIPFCSEYSLLLVLFTISSASAHILLYYIRGIEKLLDYSIISIIQTLLIAIMNYLFLIKMHYGIQGYILAYIFANLCTVLLCAYRGKILKSIKCFSIDKKLSKQMVKYSVILIPNSLMWWIMNSLDRVMVTSYIDLNANGIYAVSYKLPTIIITITTIFNQAWMFSVIKESDSKDKNEYKNSVYNFLFNVVVFSSLIIILLLKPLMHIYVGSKFFIAWKYTPALIIGTVFLTLGTFLSNEYTAHKDSMGFLKSSTIGAIVNLILNFILIPIMGIQGAAIATGVSYICVFIYRIYDTRKYLNIKFFDIKKILSLIILLFTSLATFINNNYSYVTMSLLIFFYMLMTRKFWKNNIKKITCKLFKKNRKCKIESEDFKNLQYDESLNNINSITYALCYYDSYNLDNINNYLDDLDRVKMKIRFDNSIIGQIDFSKCPYEISDVILSETKVYNFEFNNDYLLRKGYYPKQISNNYELMKYILDQDYNYLAYINTDVTDKNVLIDIINYAFTKVYYLKIKDNNIDFDIDNLFKNSSIIKHNYFKECYSYIEKMNKNYNKSKKKVKA